MRPARSDVRVWCFATNVAVQAMSRGCGRLIP